MLVATNFSTFSFVQATYAHVLRRRYKLRRHDFATGGLFIDIVDTGIM